MDTRFLESLMVVVERGSIAAAARELHVTPAAIAQRVQALEVEIGVKLLVRSGRTVAPTVAGSAVLGQARGIVRNIRALRTTALSGEIAGELRLGAIATAMTGLLPDLLKRCSLECPRLDIHVAPGTSRELYPKVLDGALDAALIVEPDFAIPKMCDWQLLREEPLVAISSECVDGDLVHMLSVSPFIRYDRNNWGGRLADLYLRSNGIRPRERFELDSLDAIAVLVDRGLGVSLVPDWAPPWPSGLSLKKRTIVDAGYARRLGMLSLTASARSHLVAAFLKQPASHGR